MNRKKTHIPRFLDCLLFVVCRDWAQGDNTFLFPVVKTEAASGACPLQGLLNCLKEIPEARHRHAIPLGVGDPPLQEDPGACPRNSGGKGYWLVREGPRTIICLLFQLQAGPHIRPSRPSLCV